jgi:alpha-L-arabinofuranosidase
MVLPMPEVHVACWHSLGAGGPWQLFYVNRSSDVTYPNAVYWAFRALREGLLDQVLESRVASLNTSGYRGGYDVRAVFMQDRSGERNSLLAINRSAQAQKATVLVAQRAGATMQVTHNLVAGTSLIDANTDDRHDRVTLQRKQSEVQFNQQGRLTLVLPPYSISSFVMEKSAGSRLKIGGRIQ